MLIPKLTKLDNSIIPRMYQDWFRLITVYNDIMYWEKEERGTRKSRVITVWDGFDSFYRLYPLKKSKREAMTMWSRLKENEQTLALDWLRKYIVYWQKKGIEKQFLPHPSTWLHGKRWEDDLSDSVTPINTLQVERAKKEIDEDKKIEEDRLWNEQALARLKASWKWEEYYNKALEETPEWQKKYERIIIARIISRLRANL